MIPKRLENIAGGWLPAHVNETLDPFRAWLLRKLLARSPRLRAQLTFATRLSRATKHQPRSLPKASVFSAVRNRTILQNLPARGPRLAPLLLAEVAFFAVAVLLVWWALPPGIVLQWTVQGEEPALFQVYRAEATNPQNGLEVNYDLLQELPISSERNTYRMLDPLLAFGQDYTYRVVAVDGSGQPTASQTIMAQGIQALPGQLSAVLLIVAVVLAALLSLRRWQQTQHLSGLRWA